MARRSGRLSAGGTTISSHKRAGSSTFASSSTEAKRLKAHVTPTKSEYFEQHDGQSDASDYDEEPPSPDEETSEFGEDDKASKMSETSDEDVTDDDEAETKTRKQSKPGHRKGAEVWRTGVKTGLGHGTQVIIKKIKARPAGDIPYRDDTIHPNTLLFLSDLKDNNDRQWLKSKSRPFRSAKVHFNLGEIFNRWSCMSYVCGWSMIYLAHLYSTILLPTILKGPAATFMVAPEVAFHTVQPTPSDAEICDTSA
nr:hypothetical protein CFP56_24622 [Quercus suber]